MFDTWKAWEGELFVIRKWHAVIENFEVHIIEWRTDSDSGNLRKILKEDGDLFLYL